LLNRRLAYCFEQSGLTFPACSRQAARAPNNDPNTIDDLTYHYYGNQLIAVDDAVSTVNGLDFNDNNHYYSAPIPEGSNVSDYSSLLISSASTPPSTAEYTYDGNGNRMMDVNKGLVEICYNEQNLPVSIDKTDGERLEYLYDANGIKKRQVYIREKGDTESGTSEEAPPSTPSDSPTTTDFAGNFVYMNNQPALVNLADGRIIYNIDGSVFAENYIKDHLGNIRVAYTLNSTGTGLIARQIDNYYPFGMNIKELTASLSASDRPNEYLYNSKMFQDEMGLNWLDYGARFYDPVLARWHSVDPLAEKYRRWSPYNYCMDNSMRFIDPDGMLVDKFYDEEGNVIRDTGEGDNEYVLKTTKTQEDIYGQDNVDKQQANLADVNGISKDEASNTKSEIHTAPVNEDGSLALSSEAQNNLVKLPTDAQQKYMSSVVATDNGNGGTAFENKSNNQEHGGIISQSGSFRRVLSGAINYIGKVASIDFGVLKGSETTFHSHPSGHVEGSRGWVQGPSSQDQVSTGKAGSFYSYVFGRANKTVYIYNNTGVVATIPDKVFK